MGYAAHENSISILAGVIEYGLWLGLGLGLENGWRWHLRHLPCDSTYILAILCAGVFIFDVALLGYG